MFSLHFLSYAQLLINYAPPTLQVENMSSVPQQ